MCSTMLHMCKAKHTNIYRHVCTQTNTPTDREIHNILVAIRHTLTHQCTMATIAWMLFFLTIYVWMNLRIIGFACCVDTHFIDQFVTLIIRSSRRCQRWWPPKKNTNNSKTTMYTLFGSFEFHQNYPSPLHNIHTTEITAYHPARLFFKCFHTKTT